MLPGSMKAPLGAVTLIAAAFLGAPVAASEPEVPDFDTLPRVVAADFHIADSYQTVFRAAPDVWCAMSYSRFTNDSSCAGRLPGMANGENYVSVWWEMLNHTGSSKISSASDVVPKPDQQHFYRPLPTGHALWLGFNYEVGTHVCGTPPGYLVVCRIDARLPDQPQQTHGFALSESGSWTF